MNKVVYNTCYGGFSLSKKASQYLNEKYGLGISENYGYVDDVLSRHDQRLVEVVELMGDEASGTYSDLRIFELEGWVYRIDEYDGLETVETPDCVDWVVIGGG